MKLVSILCIIFCIAKAKADGDEIDLKLNNVVGKSKLGTVPQALRPPGPDDEEETDNLMMVIELTRRMAPVGVYNMPVFEPYSGDLEPIELKGLLGITGTLRLTNLVIRGLQNFDYPQLLLQSRNLDNRRSKLLVFEQTYPELQFTGKLTASLSYLGIKSEIITADISGTADNIINKGSLGIDIIQKANIIGPLVYAIESFDLENNIQKLKIRLSNLKALSEKARNWKNSQSSLVSIVADNLSLAIGKAVRKNINVILNGMSVQEVDAFLLPRNVYEEITPWNYI